MEIYTYHNNKGNYTSCAFTERDTDHMLICLEMYPLQFHVDIFVYIYFNNNVHIFVTLMSLMLVQTMWYGSLAWNSSYVMDLCWKQAYAEGTDQWMSSGFVDVVRQSHHTVETKPNLKQQRSVLNKRNIICTFILRLQS